MKKTLYVCERRFHNMDSNLGFIKKNFGFIKEFEFIFIFRIDFMKKIQILGFKSRSES